MGTEKRKLQAIAGSYDPASSTKVTKTSKLGRGKTMSAVSDVSYVSSSEHDSKAR